MSSKAKTIIFSIIVPSLLGLALIAAVVWAIIAQNTSNRYKIAAEGMYTRAYGELNEELNSLNITMSKLQAAGSSNQQIQLLDDLWRSSGTCAGLMSQIPMSHVETSEMNSFIVRLNEYARRLSIDTLKGNAIAGDDIKQLANLRSACNSLSETLSKNYFSGNIPMEALDTESYFESSSDSSDIVSPSNSPFPDIIYDGVYAKENENAKPKSLNGKMLSSDEALKSVSKFLPFSCKLKVTGKSEGAVPTYEISGSTEDNRSVEISISQQGGNMIWFDIEPHGGADDIPNHDEEKELFSIAVNYLTKAGYGETAPLYGSYYGGIALVSCVAVQEDVYIYNDIIRVRIDRHDNTICGADASDYVLKHTERDLPELNITEADARSIINPALEVVSARLVLLPVTPKREVLCHELLCKLGKEKFLICIDAQTGEEEAIFRVMDSPQGVVIK